MRETEACSCGRRPERNAYIQCTMTAFRSHFGLRSLVAVAALAVAAAGGVPMCVNLIAQAMVPCTMHTEHAGSPAHRFGAVTVTPAPSSDAGCHGDAQSSGCATGGTCPSGGSAAPVPGAQVLGDAVPDHKMVFAAAAAHPSFVAPPLPPPPQA